MGRAPALVGFLLALSLALIIALAGPLLLFNPWYVSFEQARTDVPARLQTSQAEVDRVTGSILTDIWTGGDFAVTLDGQAPLLDASERSHMRDVGSLVRVLGTLLAVAALVLLFSLLTLRHERRRVGRLLLTAAGIVGTLAVVLAIVFAVAFEQAFLAFHELFFPQGNFLFGPDSNLLRLFPEPFWSEAALVAGLAIIVSAVIVTLIGWLLWRSHDATAEPPDWPPAPSSG
jgi:integral membrane protein (TIGR01906 family)